MQTSARKPTRDKQINIRATDEERAVIDYAASLVNKNRTDFIIEKAVHEAQNIILDQRVFVWTMPDISLSLSSLKRLYKMLRGVNA